MNNPYYHGSVLEQINLLEPNTGFISRLVMATRFISSLPYEGEIDKLQINSNTHSSPFIYEETIVKGKRKLVIDLMALKKQRYILPARNGNLYEFDYVVNSESLYYIDVLFDHWKVMRFRVRVKTD